MKIEKSIEKHKPKLVEYLALQDWEIDIHFMDSDSDTQGAGMDITIDISYLRALVRVYPIMGDRDEKEIVETMAHELSHIITEPMYSMCNANVNPHLQPFVEEMREQETERIARIAMKGYWK
jgi:hypothetical protein